MNRWIVLDRLGRTPLRIELPRENYDEALAAFDRVAVLLHGEWLARQQTGSKGAALRPIPWLTQHAYYILTHMLEEGLADAFDERIKAHVRYSRGTRKGLNPFQRGVMALFAHDRTSIGPRLRERMGKELWHAYRHHVPVPLVLGFLHQVRGPDFHSRAVANQLEPGFEEWIVERAALSTDSFNFRGRHPAHIEKRVEQRRAQLKREEEARCRRLQHPGDDIDWD